MTLLSVCVWRFALYSCLRRWLIVHYKSPMRNRIKIILLGVVVAMGACSNYDLSSKLENPASLVPQGGPVFVVSSNLAPSMNAGNPFAATITFNRAVTMPPGSIQIDNSASISNITTTDNITWTFNINGLGGGMYNINLTPMIVAPDGTSVTPWFLQFTNSPP